ncbi:hypothetical protein C0Q93_17530 [Streptomyces albidoflavus]|nr:hypothetical protein C0Q93_17530 [Streptomyces albidoflavus]RZE40438.1 hypothetical protein C0Q94_17545 [Streptomyces albidoflavus]RZE92779.1 hypothetical protein C0R04_17580 [Streptomyces albidoflavus]RZE93978.1 hypothetical protein C0R03_17600 [Streptomyces albidoflavus]
MDALYVLEKFLLLALVVHRFTRLLGCDVYQLKHLRVVKPVVFPFQLLATRDSETKVIPMGVDSHVIIVDLEADPHLASLSATQNVQANHSGIPWLRAFK